MSIAPNLGIEPHEPIINTSFSRNPWFLLWNQILFMNHHQIIKSHKHGEKWNHIFPWFFQVFPFSPFFPCFPLPLPFWSPIIHRFCRFCLRHEEGHEGTTCGSVAGGVRSATLQNRHLHGLVPRRWRGCRGGKNACFSLVLPWLFYHGELKAHQLGWIWGRYTSTILVSLKNQHVAMINPTEPGTLE